MRALHDHLFGRLAGDHPHEHGPETAGRLIHWADRYDRSVSLMTLGQDRVLRRRTADLARLLPGECVLDVGCGTADLTLEAKRRVGVSGLVAGIDASPEMIERARDKAARKNVELDLRLMPVERLEFPDESFQVVLSSLMMHHLPTETKRQALQEIRRVLAPGGRLVIVDIAPPRGRLGRITATLILHRRVPPGMSDLKPLVEEAGFSTEAGQLVPMFGYLRGIK